MCKELLEYHILKNSKKSSPIFENITEASMSEGLRGMGIVKADRWVLQYVQCGSVA